MVWIKAIILSLIFILLSQTEFLRRASEADLLRSLGLDLSVTAMQIAVVILMFPLLKVIFLKPLMEVMDERAQNIDSTFEEAENLKQRMTELRGSYEEKLAASEAEAREKIQAALSEAQGMKEQILRDARNQAEDIKARTTEDMQRERQKLMAELRAHVVELTLTATERLVGESMDEERQRRLISDFIETAEVGR